MEQKMTFMNDGEMEIDIKELVFTLLRKWYVILISVLLCATIGLLYVKFCVPETFRSKTSIYIYNQQSGTVTYSDLQTGTTLTKDYEVLVKSRTVLERVIADLSLPYSYEQVNNMVKVSVPTSTRIVEISVETTDPRLSQAIADAVREVSSKSIAEVMGVGAVNVVEVANYPEHKSGPNVGKYTVYGGMLGGILACGILIALFLLNDTIQTQEDVERYLGLSTLGVIPLDESLVLEEKRRKRFQKRMKGNAGAKKTK